MDLSRIVIQPYKAGVFAECKLCKSHKTYRREITLDRIVGDMTDHLSRNHPTSGTDDGKVLKTARVVIG